jgi:hypothetical protein
VKQEAADAEKNPALAEPDVDPTEETAEKNETAEGGKNDI